MMHNPIPGGWRRPSGVSQGRRFGRTSFLVCMLATILTFVVPAAVPATAADWSALEGEGVRLFVRPEAKARATALLPELESARRSIAVRLGYQGSGPIEVYLAADDASFRLLLGDRFPHWGVGAAFPQRGVIVLKPFRGDHMETLRTARHEVAHVLLFRATQSEAARDESGSRRVPTWFDEGVAMWVADEWRMQDRLEVFFAVLTGGLVPLAELDRVLEFSQARAHLAYSQSQLAITYLIELGGPGAVADVTRRVGEGEEFEAAFWKVSGVTVDQFEKRLAQFVGNRFGPGSLATSSPALWFYASILVVVSYIVVRIRNRARILEWEAEDPEDSLPAHLRPRLRVVSREEQGREGEEE